MRVTRSRVALIGSLCGAAMSATLVAQAQAPAQPQAPAQTPAAGAPAAPGRGQAGPGGRGQGGPAGRGGGRGQNQVANVTDLMQMMAALPATAPAAPPAAPAPVRRVLIYARPGPTPTGPGFVHQSIPLAARTIEALGQKTGAWTSVISYNVADMNRDNLNTFDAVVLVSTTGYFLDDADAAASADRRTAFMDFIKNGKGVVAIHAATDSYHTQGSGGDPAFPEWNSAVGGFFKSHWNFPTAALMKVEDIDNPINAAFTTTGRGGGPRTAAGAGTLLVVDEIYTYAMNSWDRKTVRVLTSIDYAKMPPEVKAAEPGTKRTDGDYPLSYIHKVGQGRVYVNVLGHDESIYKQRQHLEHLLAGVQYAIGDLKADDSPKP